ncbi:uncharacterized protein LOC125478813 [Pyrus x bretschneideri]|uniref:uncharacterized protein LOC125478813 n=1 Tax=Pyrus x bretschneideri TaxID=225117 RepID=UPI00202F30A9|nr:uncharacterized protein LOC125478813 [Pyrus x bretschneideri]
MVPPDVSSLNILEVSTTNAHVTDLNNAMGTYKLPLRQNRGVPPNRFSPEGRVRYPIANYVSCKNLAPKRQAWVNNVEAIQVLTRVKEALKDPKLAAAMDEQMIALHKNDTWEETFSPVAKMNTKKYTWIFLRGIMPEGKRNDMIITVDDSEEMMKLEQSLAAKFEMKNLADLKYYLGVEVGHLCRVSVVSQFMHSSSVDNMAAVMRILAYLKSAPGKEILYKHHRHMRIERFTDADWAGDVTDKRSTSKYLHSLEEDAMKLY